jgi:hypothetical protein
MPGSILGEILVQIVGEFVIHMVAYRTGALLVPILTFGSVKCDPWDRTVPKTRLRFGGLFHRKGSHTYLTAGFTALIGLLPWGLFIALMILRAGTAPENPP